MLSAMEVGQFSFILNFVLLSTSSLFVVFGHVVIYTWLLCSQVILMVFDAFM